MIQVGTAALVKSPTSDVPVVDIYILLVPCYITTDHSFHSRLLISWQLVTKDRFCIINNGICEIPRI